MNRSLFRPRSAVPLTRAAAEPELMLYDEIGFWGIRAAEFIKALKATAGERIHLRINSPGGDVTEGVAIFNALRAHPATIVVHIDAIAASIASLIALAGDEVRIADNAFLMVHNAWGMTIGNAADHQKTGAILDKMDTQTLVKAYVAKTGRDEAEVRDWMAAETWFTAAEAVDAGLADTIEGALEVEASFDLSVYGRVPAPLLAAQVPDFHEIRTLESALRDAGLSNNVAKVTAKVILTEGYTKPRSLQREAGDAELLAASQRLLSSLTTGVTGACPPN